MIPLASIASHRRHSPTMCVRGCPERPYAALGRAPVTDRRFRPVRPNEDDRADLPAQRSTTGYWFGKARQAGYWVGWTRRRDLEWARSAGSASAAIKRAGATRTCWECSKNSPVVRSPRARSPSLRTSKLYGSYVDHKNKITVAGYARDRACDPSALSTTARRVRS